MLNYFAPQLLLTEISGLHAARYLNARLTNDLKALNVGQSCQAAALSPQGKTEIALNALRTGAESFLLDCAPLDFANFKTRLERFKVADRFDLVDVSSELSLIHVFASDNSTEKLVELVEKIRADLTLVPVRYFKRLGEQGLDIFIQISDVEKFKAFNYATEVTLEAARLIRFKNKLPIFPDEISEEHLLIEANQWQMISDTKGCYCGQEVVEKVRSRGQMPYEILAFQCQGETTGDNQLHDSEGNKIGKILSSQHDPATNNTYGFVRIKNKHAGLKAITYQKLSLSLSPCNQN